MLGVWVRATLDRTKRPFLSQLNQSKTVVVFWRIKWSVTENDDVLFIFFSFSFVTESCWEERTQYFISRNVFYYIYVNFAGRSNFRWWRATALPKVHLSQKHRGKFWFEKLSLLSCKACWLSAVRIVLCNVALVSNWILMSGSPQDSQTQLRNPQKCGAILHNHIYIQNHNLCNSNVRWMNNPLVAQCFHITDNAFLSLTFHSSSNTT